MNLNTVCFILLSVCVFATNTVSRSTPESPDYEAVVVEYSAEGKPYQDPPLQVIGRNWAAYSRYIADAEGADIIVFPECGLTTTALPANRQELRPFLSLVPDPATSNTPLCDAPHTSFQGASQVLYNASCAARRHAIYVVFNLPEESPCEGQSHCPPDGRFIYNTNVVFDRNGSLVARYRKYHLFVEPGFDVPPRAELAVFQTDFGVRFGTFICFDVLFEAPALRLVQERHVTDVAFSTAWFSQLPFLTAVETQAGWAHANNVTMLAAGLNRPEKGCSGSAILWGDGGALSDTMRKRRGSVALRTRVPKRSRPASTRFEPQDPPVGEAPSPSTTRLTLPPAPITVSKMEHLKLMQDDLRAWATVLLPPAGGDFNATLCHGSTLCCRVEVQTEEETAAASANATHYFYRAGAYDGMHNYAGTVAAGVQACGVFACLDDTSLGSCGLAEEGRVAGLKFRRFLLTADGFQRHHALQMPSTVEAESLLPLPAASFHFEVRAQSAGGAHNRVVLATAHPLNASLLAMGVYGRAFDRDRSVRDALPPAIAINPQQATARDKSEL